MAFISGFLLTSNGRIFMLLVIGELHCQHVGTYSNAKLSRIQPVQHSCVQDHIAVSSVGMSSNDFLRKYINKFPSLVRIETISPSPQGVGIWHADTRNEENV